MSAGVQKETGEGHTSLKEEHRKSWGKHCPNRSWFGTSLIISEDVEERNVPYRRHLSVTGNRLASGKGVETQLQGRARL